MNKVLVLIAGLSIACSLCVKGFDVAHLSEKRDLKVGDQVSIKLDSNPSTGYRWYLKNGDESDEISKLESNRSSTMKYQSKYIAPINTQRRVGAPGLEEWTFVASRPGNVVIKLEYLQSWNPSSVAKSRVLEFNIK
jgi:predicted secreted protein